MSRVLLAMSGGVDSSVAAGLLREAGHEVFGLLMRHGHAEYGENIRDARRVAEMFDIPFDVLNLEKEFEQIVEYFVDEYTSGRTPNPCAVCNARLKFGRLFDYTEKINAQYIATGHYVRLIPTEDGPILCRGMDETKDQSYVLFGIKRERLPRLMFPIGMYQKAEIRQLATRLGLPVAEKKDSQDVCFIPDKDHARLIRQYHPDLATSGKIVTTNGTVMGEHDGFERFTVGQRKGLGVAMGEPYFVVRIDSDTNQVVIGKKEEIAKSMFVANQANWLIDAPTKKFDCQVKIRYRTSALKAIIKPVSVDRFEVFFSEPCYGIAPGQAAVCYDGERVLGGGWIE